MNRLGKAEQLLRDLLHSSKADLELLEEFFAEGGTDVMQAGAPGLRATRALFAAVDKFLAETS